MHPVPSTTTACMFKALLCARLWLSAEALHPFIFALALQGRH